jgi:hypothetical protein
MFTIVDHTFCIFKSSSNLPAQALNVKIQFNLIHALLSQYITCAAVKVGGADFVNSRYLKEREREVADHTSCLQVLAEREREREREMLDLLLLHEG